MADLLPPTRRRGSAALTAMAPWCWKRFSIPADGRVALIDFMPIGHANSSVIRLVKGQRGKVAMRLHLTLRFDYGTTVPWVTQLEDGSGLSAIAGPSRGGAALTGRVAGQEFRDRRRVRCCRRRMRAVRDDARPFPPAAARRDRLARGLAGDGIVLAGLVGPLLATRSHGRKRYSAHC